MSIIASLFYKGEETLPVEILDAWSSSRGKVALVKALAGEPFLAWTHGGWVLTSTMVVPACALHDVTLCVDMPDMADALQEVPA